MATIEIFKDDRFGQVRIQMDASCEPLFCANDICSALGFSNSRDAVSNHVDSDDVAKCDIIDNLGRVQKTTFINESGLYSLIFGSKLEKAREFKKWVTSEVLPSIRKTGGYYVKTEASNPSISDKMKVATWLIKTLNLDDHSKLVIAKSIADPLGLPTPEYVEDEVMLPISKILSRKGISISPQKANKKLLEIGLLEQVERYSKRKGRNEQKYIISEKGKKFGKMHQFKDASFPSPAWFVDKSDDLINLIVNTTTGGFTYGK